MNKEQDDRVEEGRHVVNEGWKSRHFYVSCSHYYTLKFKTTFMVINTCLCHQIKYAGRSNAGQKKGH